MRRTSLPSSPSCGRPHEMCSIKRASPAHRGNGGRAQENVGFVRHDTSGNNRHRARGQYVGRHTQALSRRNGNDSTCAVCGEAITPKRGSRRQRYCSDRCRDDARRARNFEISGRTRYPTTRNPRSVKNSYAKSTACEAAFVGRAPAAKAPIVTAGLGLHAGPQPSDQPERAKLIGRALRVEFAVRWPITVSRACSRP
jgi:hypothetical protein